MKELKERWCTDEGLLIRDQVLISLIKNRPFEKIQGLQKHGGRWDLRGIVFPRSDDELMEIDGYKYDRRSNHFYIINKNIEEIDFSYADISSVRLVNCQFRNVVFKNGVAKKIIVESSDFEGVDFIDVDFRYSLMNLNIRKNSGSFVNTTFKQCNLSYTHFCFPIIKNCKFHSCKMKEVNFDGSRLSDCIFEETLLEDSWFRGYSLYAKKPALSLFRRFDLKNFPNEMRDVDFSKSRLSGVSFSHGIDLSTCAFPTEENLLVVENTSLFFNKLKSKMNEIWCPEEIKKGESLIDNILYSADKREQTIDVIDLKIFKEDKENSVFNKKFIELLMSCKGSEGIA